MASGACLSCGLAPTLGARQATWDDEVTRLKLRRALVWHRVAPPTKLHLSTNHPSNQPVAASRAPRCTGPFSDPSQLGDCACIAYNIGLCVNNCAHPRYLHVCSFCLYSVQMVYNHTELHCRHKGTATNVTGGSKASDPPPSRLPKKTG